MANAELNKIWEEKEIVVKKTVQVPKDITLTLTIDEAVALQAVLWKVGGDPYTSPRGYLEKIHEALDVIIRKPQEHIDLMRLTYSGGIYFDSGKVDATEYLKGA
jgi:hypothetical protein